MQVETGTEGHFAEGTHSSCHRPQEDSSQFPTFLASSPPRPGVVATLVATWWPGARWSKSTGVGSASTLAGRHQASLCQLATQRNPSFRPCIQNARRHTRRETRLYTILWGIVLLHVASGYTCLGGDRYPHLDGGQTGKTAPCAIAKTYTTYEDSDLGDGGRGSKLIGDFRWEPLGHCSGSFQSYPLQLLGTDSHGCCCSAGRFGLGLVGNDYDWDSTDVTRYQECDWQFKPDGRTNALPCVPEVCEFEIIETPPKGTLLEYKDDLTAGREIANCTSDAPCTVPFRFNAEQPVTANFVGKDGRFEPNRLIFRPEAGDVGECPYSNEKCFGFAATEYWKPSGQALFLYTPVKYQIRTFTWKYGISKAQGETEYKEFQRTRAHSYVEKIEDAYRKLIQYNVWKPFALEACPCIGKPFICDGQTSISGCWDPTPDGGDGDDKVYRAREGGKRWGKVTLGRLMIIDLKRMIGFDAGTAIRAPGPAEDLLCSTEAPQNVCYTSEDVEKLIKDVEDGCQPGACFQWLPAKFKATGKAYNLLRIESGLSEPSQANTRVIPWNDRPSVGGAGTALRFDGVDDLAAANIDLFPRDAFTVMFWIKGIISERRNQGMMQFIAEDTGLQFQIYNADNLEVFVLDRTSGPTGVNVNLDLEWHHVAVTWTKSGVFFPNNKYQGPGVVQLFVDCNLERHATIPRAAEANAPGGRSAYGCKNAVNSEGWAWSGQLSDPASRMSARGEISLGQRMACNASTAKKRREFDRAINLENNQTYCRRKIRHECDPALNQTPNALHEGIYAPESDCKKTVSGIYVSGGSDNVTTCAFNDSDKHGSVIHGSIEKRMALDWSMSFDADESSGTATSPYAIPSVTERQSQLFLQTDCSSGCYRNENALLGYIDEVRVYNFSMSMRDIAFRNKAGIRDGVNCDEVEVPQAAGLPRFRGCSHMIDAAYKRGLIFYWPFDDGFPSYTSDSTSKNGLFDSYLSLLSYEYGAVRKNKIGNFHSGLMYAMVLGMGRNATSPMRVPSTAPVYGARLDHILYPRSTEYLLDFKLSDVDTCVNTMDILDPFSDTYYFWEPCNTGCQDSHCRNIQVTILNPKPGTRGCESACSGTIFEAKVRAECEHPISSQICAAYPECAGDLCFESTSIKVVENRFINRFYLFTGQFIEFGGNLAASGRTGMCQCDGGVCTDETFSLVDQALTTSLFYRGFSVKIELGSKVEYRTVLCHGDRRCDPSEGFPLGGRVITLNRKLPFIPNIETKYTLMKGQYKTKFLAYYFSDILVGTDKHSDHIKYDVIDLPGEAGYSLYMGGSEDINKLVFKNTLNPEAQGNAEILRWNNPEMQGNIVIGSLDVPIPLEYTVSVPEDTITLMSVDIILDDDNHATDFNLTVNGPQQYSLKERGNFSHSGATSGEMYQVLEVNCGMVKRDSQCVTLKEEQLAYATGKSGLEEVTYCDDPTYIRSDGLMEQLKRSHSLFSHGIISKICTYNENATEIYNITGYNYTCLPPCSPTLYTYQIIAPGCIENCTREREDLICENTYGLYPNQFACNGGEFHGQHCLGFNDAATCFSLTDQRAACEDRDLQPGIKGTNLKKLVDPTDPSVMLHAVYYGDIFFVDWIHRGVQAVWSEMCTDAAAALGYELILRYLIKNGCPWRDSAIDFAKARGRVTIVQYLTMLRPPFGRVNFVCGCPALRLFSVDRDSVRCVPFSKTGFECYEKCAFASGPGAEPNYDPSCQEGYSHYLAPNQVSGSEAYLIDMGRFLIGDKPDESAAPSVARCSTGSQRAIIRGPQIRFLSNETDNGLRYHEGTHVGFSKKAVICDGMITVWRGEAPMKRCNPPGPWTGFRGGSSLEFLNYHVSDKDLRVLYIPVPGNTGFAASFNYITSRMSQHPRQYNGAPLSGVPVAARIGQVNIFIDPSNDRPDPVIPNGTFTMQEDKITVMKLHWNDVDTPRQDVRAYIKDFPEHGDLYQVVEAYKFLNMSLASSSAFNGSAFLLNPDLCKTTSPDCLSGNCDLPQENCFYINETFVIGEPIYKEDLLITQFPSAIYNTTRATIQPLPTSNATECYEVNRYGGLDWEKWGGEVFCEMWYFENIPTTCRRCMNVEASRQIIPPGSWSGSLLYEPVYTQRQDSGKPIDAPNVVTRGGTCSLEEQCRLGGNTESKGSCIDWQKLAPNGRPTPFNGTAWYKVNMSSWLPWRWSEINPGQPYPCAGPLATNCSREVSYLWPGSYEPERVSRVYPPDPSKDSRSSYRNRSLTKYGDPVDSQSFYSLCRERDVYQFMAEYDKEVFMTGFDMHLPIVDGIFFRVLAWTSRFLNEDIYEMHELENFTTKVREDRSDGPKPFVAFTFSKTKRMQRKRKITKCAGEEWREVWRGYTQEGRPKKTVAESTQHGKDSDHFNLRFRFHPTNFTTKRILLQSCGFMYLSASNGNPGNPLGSFENLGLVGTYGSRPKKLVTDDVDYRVAYVPHPHFVGHDSFSFYADDGQQYCEGRECFDRKELKIGTVNITVVNENDTPLPSWLEVSGGPGETIEFELNGVDGSAELASGWIEWGHLGIGMGQGSRGGVGPLGNTQFYNLNRTDFLGSPDQEPDDNLTTIIEQGPDLGTLTLVSGRTYRYTPPVNGGGTPLAEIIYRMKDGRGLVSSRFGKVNINYICQPGHFVNQLTKTCSECPKGFYKPYKDGRTACFSCAVGTYTARTGLTACSLCDKGKFQPHPQSSRCLRCRIGHFMNETGSDRCLPCSPGTYAPRMNATTCLHCGSLSYAPMKGMFRCYDCPRSSWSSITDSSNVANCKCIHGTYKNAIFNKSVDQLWSADSVGIENESYIAPTVNIIKDPWPERLQLISSNCSACPEGSFCHGGDLPPVARIGFWTDWGSEQKSTSDSHFWENHVDAKFYRCDANNQREVCLGFPAIDIQEQNEICKLRVNWGYCDDWPHNNYTKLPDAARCKAGYEDVVCSKCIGYELQQCVPKGSDSRDGWFSWKKYARERSSASYFRKPFVDCYAIGSCRPGQDEDCDHKKDMCKENDDRCTWQTNRYYRSFDGACSECPLSILAGFLFYLTWFAIFCAVVMCILALALTDMNSFSITVTFWQTAAMFARYRIPWPEQAQSLLSLYSISNVNLDGIPWMCFFNSAPGFRDIWFLTNLTIAGLVGASIVRWILPFLAVPPQGKVLIQQFKTALSRRDMLKGVGSVARVQYLQRRSNQTEILRPSSVAPSQHSRRSSSRPGTGGSRRGKRPTSALSGARSRVSSDDIVLTEHVEINAEQSDSRPLHGQSFGFAPRSIARVPSVLSEATRSGPRSRASLIPSASSEEEKGDELPGAASSLSPTSNDNRPDMILEESNPVGTTSGEGIRVYGSSFGLGFFKKKTGGERPSSAQELLESTGTAITGGSAGGAGSQRNDVAAALSHPTSSSRARSVEATGDDVDAQDTMPTKGKQSNRRLLSFSKAGAVSAISRGQKSLDEAGSFQTQDNIGEVPETVPEDSTASFTPQKKKGKGIFSFFSSKKLAVVEESPQAQGAEEINKAKSNQGDTRDQTSSRPQSGTSARSRPRSALKPPRAPDVLVLEDIHELTALSRPQSGVSRPWSAASGISRPESAKSVSFQNTPASSRPGTASNRRPTPSTLQRERDGWREFRTDNPFQAHTPRMDQRLNSARSDGSSKEVPMDLGGIAWYVRKQYFDMAWRHAVATLSVLYICGCQKTLQALKWTWWTYSPVSKIAVLDWDPSVRIFDIQHAPVFPFALMAFPITVAGPAINFFWLYSGYKLRTLDDTSFSMRWGYLLDPFERKYWFWSIIIAVRKFIVVFAQTFMRNSLYLQKFVPAITICLNILLNYLYRPYRVERHNVYENILLVCLVFILLLGLITPLDITVYHDARGKNFPGPFDTYIVFGVLVIQGLAFFVSLVCIYADILDAQLRTPKLIKAVYLLTLGPIEMVLRILRNILELLLRTIWWLLGKIGIMKKEPEHDPMKSARARSAKKKKQSRYVNPQALNRGSGDPPEVTGNRYADILWEKVFKTFRQNKRVKILNSFEDDYDELVRPDDGAKWLRDRFSIRKRIFLIERRLQRQALYDPKSTTILRMERQLTVALDAAISQLKRERDAYFDQLYDSQSEYEAICIDRDVAQGRLDEQDQKLTKVVDVARFARAKLDATIRRTGQPEDWKKRFLEEQAKRLELEEEIVDLQAQVETIRLENDEEDHTDKNV